MNRIACTHPTPTRSRRVGCGASGPLAELNLPVAGKAFCAFGASALREQVNVQPPGEVRQRGR